MAKVNTVFMTWDVIIILQSFMLMFVSGPTNRDILVDMLVRIRVPYLGNLYGTHYFQEIEHYSFLPLYFFSFVLPLFFLSSICVSVFFFCKSLVF